MPVCVYCQQAVQHGSYDDDDNDDGDADADDADAGSPDNAVGESAYIGVAANEHTVNSYTDVRGSEDNAAANYCEGIPDVASILKVLLISDCNACCCTT